jgi:hypothetical protein
MPWYHTERHRICITGEYSRFYQIVGISFSHTCHLVRSFDRLPHILQPNRHTHLLRILIQDLKHRAPTTSTPSPVNLN